MSVLTQTLAALGGRLDSALKLLSALAELTAIPVKTSALTEAALAILKILVRDVADIDSCSILLHDPETDVLGLVAAWGQADLVEEPEEPYNKNLSFKPGEGGAGRVFLEKMPLFLNPEEPDGEVLKEDLGLKKPHSLACLPLSTLGRVLGVLNVSFTEPAPFDQPRRRDLIMLASVVANLIQTFFLQAELDQYASSLAVKVEASEQRYADLADSLPETVFETDGQYAFTYLNRTGQQHLGLEQADLEQGLNLFEVIVPDDRPRARRVLSRLSPSRPTARLELGLMSRRGGIFPAQFHVTQVFQAGEAVALRGIAQDLSEQKKVEAERRRLEARLRQSQKMEAIGTLAGGIAHDFNNILTAIMGYAELASTKLKTGHPGRTHLDQVIQAGHRAGQLVSQILSFSRQTEQERKPVIVRPIVKETLNLLKATLPKNIEVKSDLAPNGSAVMADPAQIHQLLMNLCTNAAQAMRETGGQLFVGLGRVALDETVLARLPELVPGAYLRLTVRDTGCGMDQKTIERIFEPFFTTKRQANGTGLGLSVVHGIVKGLKGAITVESEPGQGATFQVFLPLLEGQVETERLIRRPEPAGGTERLLLVDDEASIAELGREALESYGYQVVSLTDGPSALNLFKSDPGRFDLVVTDQTMPHLTGLELAKHLLSVRPDLPVILCTGFSEDLTEEKARQTGIRRVVPKPLLNRELARIIRSVLDESYPGYTRN